MKFFAIICLLLPLALAFPFPQRAFNQRAGKSVGGNAPAAKPVNPYGPKAYGPGLNNPFAFKPHPFMVQQALRVANMHPNLLVRVNVNGEVDLTDRFGREVDGVYDSFGFDLSDLYDF